MKVAVPVKEKSLNSEIDDRFARCSYFLIYDIETGEHEFIKNEMGDAHGAGPKVVQFLSGKGVKAVISKNIGENAMNALRASGIEAYIPSATTAEENLKLLKEGKLGRF